MRIIGITGGVGAGKSEILNYIEKSCSARVVKADDVAHMLMRPGQVCYTRLLGILGSDILNEDGTIDRVRMGNKTVTLNLYKSV